MKLIGPFTQLLTMNHLPLKGALTDKQLEVFSNVGILVENGNIVEVGDFDLLQSKAKKFNHKIEFVQKELVAFPGFIDAHTHICWAGSRANDYALRLQGKTYLEIAQTGGGIWSTVIKTRAAIKADLETVVVDRANSMLRDGVTTIEVKSGYGLTVDNELKMLRAIKNANSKTDADLISTCLAAHICPKDFKGTIKDYLNHVLKELLPKVQEENLSKRIDVFIEDSAFSVDEARTYLIAAEHMGFDLIIHGDQFTTGGSSLAVEIGALSVDHLEASNEKTILKLSESNVVAVVLPGASIGLGEPFAPARKLLDAGTCLAIASDWNPGSAPMGDLLIQAAVLAAFEKLTIAETLAGITFRAAKALNLNDRGILKTGNIADLVAFNTNDYREVLYRQGKLKPSMVWKKGKKAFPTPC